MYLPRILYQKWELVAPFMVAGSVVDGSREHSSRVIASVRNKPGIDDKIAAAPPQPLRARGGEARWRSTKHLNLGLETR